VLRTAVKGGIRTGPWLSQAAEKTREHLEDVVAEARHEMGEEEAGRLGLARRAQLAAPAALPAPAPGGSRAENTAVPVIERHCERKVCFACNQIALGWQRHFATAQGRNT
jgi:hypothetical protein